MKIAFFAGVNDRFIQPIILRLSQFHDVKQFKADTIQALYEMMKWSDISWVEWCEPILNACIRVKMENNLTTRIINRIHSYEVFTDLPGQIDWRAVNDVVFVAEHIRKIACDKFKQIEQNCKIHVIANGVDMNRFDLQEHKHGYSIGYVGYINNKKNPGLLLDVMHDLTQRNPEYKLHIAGIHQEQRIQLYMEQRIKALYLQDNIIWHGWVNDIAGFWSTMDYAINTSYLESFCYGIAEAMACGVKPLIHDFVGAEGIYPRKYIWHGVDHIKYMIKPDSEYISQEYRAWIANRYDLDKQIDKITELIKGV